MLKKTIAISLILLATSNLSAREFADIYTECGLGAMIAPNNEAVAAVTNVTWDLGTTAVTSNISSPDTCVGGKARVASFIHQSYDKLEQEIAMGSGEYLDTLVKLRGVENQSKAEFIASIRDSIAETISNDNYSKMTQIEKSEALYNIVYSQTQI